MISQGARIEQMRALCYVRCMTISFPPALPGSCVAPNAPQKIEPVSDTARMFALEYVKDFKANRAAERCKMSPAWGYTQMNDLRVMALIRENSRKRIEEVDISIADAMNSLAVMKRVDVTMYYREEWVTPSPYMDPATLQLVQPAPYLSREIVPFDEWTDEMKMGCAEIEATKFGYRVKLYNKVDINVHIGRYFNIWTDTKQLTGPGGGPVVMIDATMSPEDAARAWADTLSEGRK